MRLLQRGKVDGLEQHALLAANQRFEATQLTISFFLKHATRMSDCTVKNSKTVTPLHLLHLGLSRNLCHQSLAIRFFGKGKQVAMLLEQAMGEALRPGLRSDSRNRN